MSLIDQTNETIHLGIHAPMVEGGIILHYAQLNVDIDHDSSCIPSIWVDLALTDADHDSDTIHLTLHEAGLLHDRLGLILGRKGSA